MNKELRDACRKLFEGKKVEKIVGYTKGSLPLQPTPCVIKSKEEVDKLIFDITCGNNLTTYLQKVKSEKLKVGIVAKGCDGRSIVQYIVEGQIKREDIVIIGLPCEGVVDLKKIKEKATGKEILDYKIEDNKIMLEGRDFKVSLSKQELLDTACLSCKYPNPPVYDIFIGEPVSVAERGSTSRGSTSNRNPITDSLEKMSPDERWAYFEREISKCIRCYGCRNACPVCYCEECFVDQTTPQWFGKSTHISDTMIFHIVRLLHVAGRCVGCGACSRACPMGINLAPLGIRIEKEIKDRFGYTAGLDLETIPPMAAYKENDKQEFIME